MSTESTLRLVGELHAGRTIGRAEAAKILATKIAAADKQLGVLTRLLPVERLKRRGKVLYRWKLREGALTRPIPVATVLAGYFGSSLAKLFEGTVYEPGMRNVAETLLDISGRSRGFENADRQFVFLTRGGEVALPSKEKVLDDIIQVLQDSHRARLVYRSAEGQRSALSVQPLSIAIYDHQLYLIARRTDGTFHPYRFARIERVTRLPQRAQYPPQTEYDPEQVFRDSIGVYVDDRFPVQDVEVLVSKRWKTFMESHRWHRSQRLISTKLGYLLRMRVRICPELERWVLGFGAEARVVRPEALRARVARISGEMHALYSDERKPR